jgi:ElaA protein
VKQSHKKQFITFETMNEIIWQCKPFKELTNEELYQIFRLRISVFVVEQNCPYQDADGKDLKSLHVTGKQNGELIAYTRIVLPGVSYKEISIGRVVTSTEARRTGAGKILMKKTMEFIKKEFGNVPIRIGAQLYLQKFYESFSFVRQGDEYLEDGIPHIIMLFVPR